MDAVHRFLLEDLDIRGALVQLGPSWTAMNAQRHYAPPVRELLGEMAAVTALIGSNLKAPGRLSFQLQGHGAVSMLVMDCNEKLQLRGMARSGLSAEAESRVTGIEELLGDGRLVLTLQPKTSLTPYQSVVPLAGRQRGRRLRALPGKIRAAAGAAVAQGVGRPTPPAACSCKSCPTPTSSTPTAGTASKRWPPR
jgi:redox-regulated HSP33 family molecular chaperone